MPLVLGFLRAGRGIHRNSMTLIYLLDSTKYSQLEENTKRLFHVYEFTNYDVFYMPEESSLPSEPRVYTHLHVCVITYIFHWSRKMTKSCQILYVLPLPISHLFAPFLSFDSVLHSFFTQRTYQLCWNNPLFYFLSFWVPWRQGVLFIYFFSSIQFQDQHDFQLLLSTWGIFVPRRQFTKLIGMRSVGYKLKIGGEERRP